MTTKRSDFPLIKQTLSTLLGTILGTVTLVGMHHYYRRQQYPDAHWQDYLSGVRDLSSAKLPLSRVHYAYQQATKSWQHAYYHYDEQAKSAEACTQWHTTTMLARPVCWVSGVASMPPHISLKNAGNTPDINTVTNADDSGFGVVGIDADRQLVWQTTMPERVHDIVVQPLIKGDKTDSSNDNNGASHRHVVVMGRRPSTGFWVLDTATGQVQFALKAAAQRHFYGHACYSLDGSLLYITENDTVTLNGKIGVYDADNCYQKIAEFDSQGIGPHELMMHPDGDTLVIANGGIKTEQASREELNLDSMRPSLVYLNRHHGALLEQIVPEHNQMSIRHLAMHDNGTVMIGIQFQGERHLNVPLVLTHQRGDAAFTALKMPHNQWQRFHHYIASVAVDSQSNLLCVTTPIGGCAAVYDLDTYELIESICLPDCAGASVLSKAGESGFIVSDGQGQLTRLMLDKQAQNRRILKDSQWHNMSFDNHLQVLGQVNQHTLIDDSGFKNQTAS